MALHTTYQIIADASYFWSSHLADYFWWQWFIKWLHSIHSCIAVNLVPTQSHIWHMLCNICFTIILCWLHLRRIWHTMCQKNGEAYLTHVKQNMLHMWLIVLHMRQLCQIVSYLTLCRDRFTVYMFKYKMYMQLMLCFCTL
jgi:hypothetical protein